MKEYMKKAAALLAAVLMVMAVTVTSFAATDAPRQRPSGSTSQSSQRSTDDSRSSDDDDEDEDDRSSSSDEDEDDSDSSSSVKATKATQAPPVETQPPVTTQAPQAAAQNKSYTTKGGAFLWFLLSVIVNTIISFAIGKRFYNLARKSNHVQSEIRALRRDIEEKFADSIGDFSEPAMDISNSNDDYSAGEDGIKMSPMSKSNQDANEPEDVYKEWEAQFARRRAERREALRTPSYNSGDDADDDIDEEMPRRSTRKYQPARSSVRERFEARRAVQNTNEYEDDDDDIVEEETPSRLAGLGSKAKQLLGGIFPMNDDDE